MTTLAQALGAINANSLKHVHDRVAAVDHSEVPRLLSQLMAEDGIAVLAVTYPAVDAGNHKSLNALVSQLAQHGMADTAGLLDTELPYLLMNDPVKALRVYHEIQKDSVAICVTLHFAGVSGPAAVSLLKARAPKAE